MRKITSYRSKTGLTAKRSNRWLAIGLTVLCTVLLPACHKPVKVTSVTTEAIPVNASSDAIQDSSYIRELAPVKADLEKAMNVQIGYAPEDMWVGSPECPMLNWATDALWEAAKKAYPGRVDIAIKVHRSSSSASPSPVTAHKA